MISFQYAQAIYTVCVGTSIPYACPGAQATRQTDRQTDKRGRSLPQKEVLSDVVNAVKSPPASACCLPALPACLLASSERLRRPRRVYRRPEGHSRVSVGLRFEGRRKETPTATPATLAKQVGPHPPSKPLSPCLGLRERPNVF
jgi:hypothetical protein